MIQLIERCSLLRVLDVFFQDPHKNYQVREIGRIIKLDHKSVLIYLKKLKQMKLVKIDTTTLYKSYRADINEDFKKIKMAFNVIKLQESGLLDYLFERALPKAVVLYGSYAKGIDGSKSDIDLYIDSPEKKLELVKFEKKMGRKIHLLFEGKMSKELKNNLINGIVLKGNLRLLA
ncbi:MAG: nucleotidyltransferase domain-containing protein [Nanoarchaeota archaeon]|nr:nucleotidyltransferase domain-containing protein [Nanoarchaeota archaeon]